MTLGVDDIYIIFASDNSPITRPDAPILTNRPSFTPDYRPTIAAGHLTALNRKNWSDTIFEALSPRLITSTVTIAFKIAPDQRLVSVIHIFDSQASVCPPISEQVAEYENADTIAKRL